MPPDDPASRGAWRQAASFHEYQDEAQLKEHCPPVTESVVLALIAAAHIGEPVVFTVPSPQDVETGHGLGEIDSDDLRQSLIDLAGHVTDPLGLTIVGASFAGPLDLRGVICDFPVSLQSCRFADGLTMIEASFRGLSLPGSMIAGDWDASGMRVVGQLWLGAEFVCTGSIRMADVQVDGQFLIEHAKISGADEEGYAIRMDGLQTSSHLTLRDVLLESGALSVRGGRIGAQLRIYRVNIAGTNSAKAAISGDHLDVEGNLELGPALACVSGSVRLNGTVCRGQIRFSEISVQATDTYGYSVTLDDVRAPTLYFLDDQSRLSGPLRMRAISIDGQLKLDSLEITGTTEGDVSILAQRISVDDLLIGPSLSCEGGLDLRSSDVHGHLLLEGPSEYPEIDLQYAHIRLLMTPDEAEDLPMLRCDGWQLQAIHGCITDTATASTWLKSDGSPITTQPWNVLADCLERQGKPEGARKVRYAALNEVQAKFGHPRRFSRWLYKLTCGYGYYPGRLIWCVLALIAASIGLAYQAKCDLVPSAAVSRADQTIGQFDPLWFGLGMVLPTSPHDTTDWMLPSGDPRLLAFAAIRLASWALLAMVLAATTGLLRKL